MTPLLPDNLEGRTVVDVASGTGRWARYCRQRGARAIAVDFCFEMRPSAGRPMRRSFLGGCLGRYDHLRVRAQGPARPSRNWCVITRPGGMLVVMTSTLTRLKRGWTAIVPPSWNGIPGRRPAVCARRSVGTRPRVVAADRRRLGPPECEFLESSGHLERFEEARREPAIFVARWFRK